jgi:predicted anti-sigma-YlaC factor YlaD
MNTHLTDLEIKHLAEELYEVEKQFTGHLEACSSCSAKYAMYKLLFKEINLSHSPVVPAGFADKVMEVVAKKREQQIMFRYRFFYGAITGISLTAIILLELNINIIKMFTEFHSVSPGKVSAVESVLLLGAVAFFYICLSGYKNRFKKNYLLSDITF